MSNQLHGAAEATASAPPGHRLGGCQLLRVLGKGGLGEVYEALATDGRRVAVKAFQIRDDDQGLLASAFVREANLGERLDHPDIVKVLSSGCEGEYAYLVMEYVAAPDLRVHTVKGQLFAVGDTLHVVERVARALAAAHALHVIHRDIKPGNVLVDLATGIVKLTDFGLARLGDAFRSRTGIIAGTPCYMSPEQLAEGEVGPTSDIYSLGVLLFEMLTGRLPHDAVTMGALLIQATQRTAPRVSTLRSGLPPGLVALVAEMLDKRADRRPTGALAVAEHLMSLRAALPPAPAAGQAGPKSHA